MTVAALTTAPGHQHRTVTHDGRIADHRKPADRCHRGDPSRLTAPNGRGARGVVADAGKDGVDLQTLNDRFELLVGPEHLDTEVLDASSVGADRANHPVTTVDQRFEAHPSVTAGADHEHSGRRFRSSHTGHSTGAVNACLGCESHVMSRDSNWSRRSS